MELHSDFPGHGSFIAFRGAAVRTGVCTGAALSVVFAAWLIVANRVPALETFAPERNITAAAAIALLGLFPIVRFYRMPGRLWTSGVLAWLMLSLCYRLFSFFFSGLTERYSAFQIFMVGGVIYTIVSTICWIGTVAWRMYFSHHAANGVSHVSTPSSNQRMS
jgi:uncharacterized membrane protein YvlD (DUF360 family)